MLIKRFKDSLPELYRIPPAAAASSPLLGTCVSGQLGWTICDFFFGAAQIVDSA